MQICTRPNKTDGLTTVLFACCISLRAGNSTLQLELLLFHSFSELKVFIKHISSEIHVLKGGNQLNLFTEAWFVWVCVCVSELPVNR